MEAFNRVQGIAAPFPAANVDTDVIMPKTFLKGVDRTGLDIGVFNLLRFPKGKPNPDFILNKPEYCDAKFLVVGPNFGCGSSREHAVWGLSQLGFRALIGTSFAGIFNDNCRNNGVLTITLAEETIERIIRTVSVPETNLIAVDLQSQLVELDQGSVKIPFSIEPLRKEALMSGLDTIGITLSRSSGIREFEKRYGAENPWLF